MSKRIIAVKALSDFEIVATFQNGISRRYDMKKLFGVFPQFLDFLTVEGLFEQVKVDIGGYGISWNDDLDLDANDIWEDGIEAGGQQEVNIVSQLACSMIQTRQEVGMTQKQLSDITRISQADISRIERGLANPSVSILKRLAEGMGVRLRIEFEKNSADL